MTADHSSSLTDHVFLLFWTTMIFASIFWYGFLLFYIGIKGGREIRKLIQSKASPIQERGGDGSSPAT